MEVPTIKIHYSCGIEFSENSLASFLRFHWLQNHAPFDRQCRASSVAAEVEPSLFAQAATDRAL